MQIRLVKSFDVRPVAKPRMTHYDRGKITGRTQAYWAFATELAFKQGSYNFENGDWIVFHYPMPKSWSKKIRKIHCGTEMQSTPDVDNFLKAFFDALYAQDSKFWDVRISKIWAEQGRIDIYRGQISYAEMIRDVFGGDA